MSYIICRSIVVHDEMAERSRMTQRINNNSELFQPCSQNKCVSAPTKLVEME